MSRIRHGKETDSGVTTHTQYNHTNNKNLALDHISGATISMARVFSINHVTLANTRGCRVLTYGQSLCSLYSQP